MKKYTQTVILLLLLAILGVEVYTTFIKKEEYFSPFEGSSFSFGGGSPSESGGDFGYTVQTSNQDYNTSSGRSSPSRDDTDSSRGDVVKVTGGGYSSPPDQSSPWGISSGSGGWSPSDWMADTKTYQQGSKDYLMSSTEDPQQKAFLDGRRRNLVHPRRVAFSPTDIEMQKKAAKAYTENTPAYKAAVAAREKVLQSPVFKKFETFVTTEEELNKMTQLVWSLPDSPDKVEKSNAYQTLENLLQNNKVSPGALQTLLSEVLNKYPTQITGYIDGYVSGYQVSPVFQSIFSLIRPTSENMRSVLVWMKNLPEGESGPIATSLSLANEADMENILDSVNSAYQSQGDSIAVIDQYLQVEANKLAQAIAEGKATVADIATFINVYQGVSFIPENQPETINILPGWAATLMVGLLSIATGTFKPIGEWSGTVSTFAKLAGLSKVTPIPFDF